MRGWVNLSDGEWGWGISYRCFSLRWGDREESLETPQVVGKQIRIEKTSKGVYVSVRLERSGGWFTSYSTVSCRKLMLDKLRPCNLERVMKRFNLSWHDVVT